MSWLSTVFYQIAPWISGVITNPDFQKAGEAALHGIAASIKTNANNPGALTQLADHLVQDAPKIVGAIAANTPAAQHVAQENLPPADAAKGNAPKG